MLEEKLNSPAAHISEHEPSAELLTPWYLPESHFEELPGILCATDLLAAWQPDAVAPLSSSSPDARWDTYFSATPASSLEATLALSEPARSEVWNPTAAASAVDCLYRFIHALEQSDIDQAMSCIAADYHLFENEIDMDIHFLRMRLEQFLDEWRGPECRVSLTEIPDPVFFTRGILIQATLQIDYLHKIKQAMNTVLLGYLIRFDAEPGQEWLIHAFHRVG
jgi:hypothetical protein